jgi:signal transduction histidine kinase
LRKFEQNEAFNKAKNVDWLIEHIKEDCDLSSNERARLLEISQFNKRIRYFIHSTLAFVENPLPFGIERRIKKTLKEEFISSDWESIISKDLSYHLSEVYRIRKAVEQFYILSDADYGDWHSSEISVEELIGYLNIYKQRFDTFYFNNQYYHIRVAIINNASLDCKLILPTVKLKEVLDVLLHNAAEELVEKFKKESFTTKIECILDANENNFSISISDNGRGILGDTNLKTPFFTTKNNFKNSGIGLDIANKIARIFKGTLINSNNEYGGATFKFTFPKQIEVKQDGFRHKINILLLDHSKGVEAKLKELMQEHVDVQVIRAESKGIIEEFSNEKIISCIDIVLCSQGNDLIQYVTDANFKGDVFYA